MLDLDQYPAELQQLIADYPIHLLEARLYSNLANFRTDIKYVLGFLQRDNDKALLAEYVRENEVVFSDLDEDTYNVISVMSHSEELQKFSEEDNKGGKSDLCQAIKEMIEDGRAAGRQEGIQAGIQAGIQEGENRFKQLINKMSNAGETDQLARLGTDAEFLQEMYVKYEV